MAIELLPLGQISIFPENVWEVTNGPKGKRTTTAFREAIWLGEIKGEAINARSHWGNGTYLEGSTGIAEPEIRIMFETDQNEFIFLHYFARINIEKQSNGEVPGPLLSGRIETEAPRYNWLNETMVVGDGTFTFNDDEIRMDYFLQALGRA